MFRGIPLSRVMAIPFTLDGHFAMEDDQSESQVDVLKRLATAIGEAKPRNLKVADGSVIFDNGFLPFALPWNPLIGISSGRIWIRTTAEGTSVCYRVSLYQLFLTILAGVPLGLVFIQMLNSHFKIFTLPLRPFLIAWTWLLLVNYVIIPLRFRKYLKDRSNGR